MPATLEDEYRILNEVEINHIDVSGLDVQRHIDFFKCTEFRSFNYSNLAFEQLMILITIAVTNEIFHFLR